MKRVSDRQKCVRETLKKSLIQWHVLLMCHCHLQTAVEIEKVFCEVEGKNEDISSSITDMPLSLTNCSGDKKVCL